MINRFEKQNYAMFAKFMTADASIDVDALEYVEGPMESLHGSSAIFRCGLCLVCTSGKCTVSTGASTYNMTEGTGIVFVTGTLFQLDDCADDLCFRGILFPKRRFTDVVVNLDTALFNYMHEYPCYVYDGSPERIAAFRGINLWMDMAGMLFSGTFRSDDLRVQEEDNFLRGLFLWMRRNLDTGGRAGENGKDRTVSLCHRFLGLVHEFAAQEHSVRFYADRLCITPRYLNKITVMHVDGLSPKKIIDDQLVAEIKVRLVNSSLSITQIAGELNFSDQTYMSSFFRRLTGRSPADYRKSAAR